jgi:hypothetical protein
VSLTFHSALRKLNTEGHEEYDKVKSEFQKSGGAGTIVKVSCVKRIQIRGHKKIFIINLLQFILFCHYEMIKLTV